MNLKEFVEKNGYYLKDEIDFEWDRYGNGIPSVTTILKLIGDKSFDFVLSQYEDKVKESADKGTKVHNDAENFFSGNFEKSKDGGLIPIELNPNIMKFHSLCVIETINTEQRYERGGMSGTIDLEASMAIKGTTGDFNGDYKNAKVKSEKYKLQMGGYKYLNGKDGVIIYVGKKLEIIQVESFYEDIFIELKELFFKLLREKGQQ